MVTKLSPRAIRVLGDLSSEYETGYVRWKWSSGMRYESDKFDSIIDILMTKGHVDKSDTGYYRRTPAGDAALAEAEGAGK